MLKALSVITRIMTNGKIILNKYKITRKIGNGAFSNVFEAKHLYKDTYVAIKFDNDEASKKLRKKRNQHLSIFIEK